MKSQDEVTKLLRMRARDLFDAGMARAAQKDIEKAQRREEVR